MVQAQPGAQVEKLGFVRRFALNLEVNPENPTPLETALERQTYFTVVVSDAPDADTNAVEFRMVRITQSGAADMSQGQFPLAVTWQGVSMAMIATIKDALLAGKQVRAKGEVRMAAPLGGMVPIGDRYNALSNLEIQG
jgi:hypothetical protein